MHFFIINYVTLDSIELILNLLKTLSFSLWQERYNKYNTHNTCKGKHPKCRVGTKCRHNVTEKFSYYK